MLGKYLHITLSHMDVYLLPQRAMYVPLHQLLVIADWHLGKIPHFRKNGIFVPKNEIADELQHLTDLIDGYPTRHVLFLGDLFHSTWNPDWEAFINYLVDFEQLEFSLVKGNHDLIDFKRHNLGNLTIYEQWELENQFLFTHQPLPSVPPKKLNVTGHIHPGVIIRGKGKQHYRLPCFYQENQTFILPAFGKYTGLHTMPLSKEASIYPIVGDEVVRLDH